MRYVCCCRKISTCCATYVIILWLVEPLFLGSTMGRSQQVLIALLLSSWMMYIMAVPTNIQIQQTPQKPLQHHPTNSAKVYGNLRNGTAQSNTISWQVCLLIIQYMQVTYLWHQIHSYNDLNEWPQILKKQSVYFKYVFHI